MAAERATQVLMDEHRGIEKMLTAMEQSLPRLEAGDGSVVPLFEQGVDFLSHFADQCHHHKEEKVLFPLLAKKGIPVEGGPVGVMLHEHEQGRGYIRGMKEAIERYRSGDASALRDLAAAAGGYIALLRTHIFKEDNVLFQMADRILSPEEQGKLIETFDQVETEVMGVGTHERYHKMLASLDAE